MLSFDNFSEKESIYLLTVLVAVAFGTLLVFSFQSRSSKGKLHHYQNKIIIFISLRCKIDAVTISAYFSSVFFCFFSVKIHYVTYL